MTYVDGAAHHVRKITRLSPSTVHRRRAGGEAGNETIRQSWSESLWVYLRAILTITVKMSITCNSITKLSFSRIIIPCMHMRSKRQSNRFGSLAVGQSVCQSVCGHKNEHFEQIRNACSSLLWQMGSKLKNKNLHTLHTQNHRKGCEKRGFSLSVQIIEQNHALISIFSYLLPVVLVRKKDSDY